MLNVLDLEDAQIRARQRMAKAQQEFQQRFYQPVTDAQASMMLSNLAARLDPEAAARVRQVFGGQDARKKSNV